MVGLEILKSVLVAVNQTGRRNFTTASFHLAGKKSSSASGSGSGSSENKPSSSEVDILGKVQDPPPTVFKKVETKEIGPGASKTGKYKNPEYFSYHDMSYAEMDVIMEKYRCPQPSSLKK